MRFLCSIILSTAMLWSPISQAQSRKFAEGFNTAKLHLANHKIENALPVLEELYAADPSNANINYLLGLCYVKTGKEIPKAIKVLEFASKYFAKDYDASSHTERRAPEYVYYYLLIAYSMDLQCKPALETLNQFYKIYSYEDEYYLIDGQKWVRECHNRKKEDEPEEEPAIAEAKPEPKPEPEPELTPEPVVEEPEPVEEEVVADATPEPEPVEEEPVVEEKPGPTPAPPAAPVFKDRLVRADLHKNLGTKNIDYTTLLSLYGVQVGAFLEPKFTRDFDRLKNVEVYIDQNGVFRYVVGRFLYKAQAEKLLAHIQRAGYQDAFIVDVNNDKYSEEVVTIDHESIHGEIAGRVDFKVQIGAFRHQIPDSLALVYLQIEDIREYTHGDLTILTVGSFDNYEAARAQRDDVRNKWIKDAFVVAYNYDRKIPIKDATNYLQAKRREAEEQELSDSKNKKNKAKASKDKAQKPKGKGKKATEGTEKKDSDL